MLTPSWSVQYEPNALAVLQPSAHLRILGGRAAGRVACLLSLLRTVFAQDLTVSGGCQESLVIAPAVNVAEVKPSSCTNRARASDLGSTVEHR